ncbi:ribonuclease H-like domain-containing protein [Tanacetum coccineum]
MTSAASRQGNSVPSGYLCIPKHTTLPMLRFALKPPQNPTCTWIQVPSSHLNFKASNLSTIFDKLLFPSVHVGDGKSIPVTNTGHNIIPSHHRPLHLNNVLVTPNIIINLISVGQFTRDNNCTIEFDAFGFSMKDYLTRHILLQCDSSGDLYPDTRASTLPNYFSLDKCSSTWHQRPRTNSGDQTYFKQIIGLFLSQKKYALQLLERAHMVICNPSRTPVDTESKLSPEVQQICLYKSCFRRATFYPALKRILRYVQGTLDLGLHLYASSTTSLVGYTDADWAGCPSTRSAEAEYRGVANVVAETAWLRNLLRELHSPLSTATLVYCDNLSFLHVPSARFQYADIHTRDSSALFEEFRSSLSVRPPPAPTAGAY